MPRRPQDITDAELAVLQVLWREGPLPIRRIADILYPRGNNSHYATVQKLLERLEAKESVCRDRSSATHTFEATLGRDDLVGRRLEAVAEALCGGSWTPLLTHLVQKDKLSQAERQMLRQLVHDLDEPKKDRRGKERP